MKILSITVCLLGFIVLFLAAIGCELTAKADEIWLIFHESIFLIMSTIFLCSMFIIIAIYKNKQ